MHGQRPLSLVLLATLTAAPTAAASPLSIHGRIDLGAPRAKVVVSLVRSVAASEQARLVLAGAAQPGPAAMTTVSGDGSFQLTAPEPGMWRVLVESSGALPMEIGLTPLTEPVELPPLALIAAREVTVHALDAAGRPVAGARVSVTARAASGGGGPGPDWSPAPRVALARADGTAVLALGQAETSRLAVIAPGYAPADFAPPAGPTLTIHLDRGATRAVAVRDRQDRAIAKAVVVIDGLPAGETPDDGWLEVATRPGQTSALEAFTLDGRHGRAQLLPAAERTVLRIEDLERLGGSVLALPGREPIAGALVWTDEDPGAVVRTRPDGGFDLPLPARSPARLQAAAPGFLPSPALPAPAANPRRSLTFALAPAAALAVRVVDEAERPVAGAEIAARPLAGERTASKLAPRARSGKSGESRLSPLAPGARYRLEVTREGFVPLRLAVAAPRDPMPQEPLRVVLQRGRPALGRVVDAAGRPVSSAEVVLLPASFGSDVESFVVGPELVVRATTGLDGRFHLERLPAGRWDLNVVARGFTPSLVNGVDVAAGEGSADLGMVVLAPASTLTGRVVDSAGQPVAGARVFRLASDPASSRLAAALGTLPPAVSSGPDGRFELGGLKPGETFTLRIERQGYLPAIRTGVGAEAGPIEVRLDPASRLGGRIRSEDGEPVADARVLVLKPSSAGPRIAATAAANAAGAFHLDGLEPGPARVTALAPGWLPATAEVEIPAGGEPPAIELTLTRGVAVEGRVTGSDGVPMAGATVRALLQNLELPLGVGLPETLTDGDGGYRLEGLPEGRTEVVASRPDRSSARGVIAARTGVNRLDLRLGRSLAVAGHVVATDGTAAAGVAVELSPLSASSGAQTATTGPDGDFRFGDVAEGEYALTAASASATASKTLQLSGAPMEDVELRLDSGGSIQGSVIGLGRDAFAAVEIVATAPGSVRTARPDFDGHYRLAGLASGEWQVVARDNAGREARARGRLDADTAELTLDLRFDPGLSLSGLVLAGGTPVAGALIAARGVDVAGFGGAVSEADGRFRIGDLPAGTYDVTVVRRSGGPSILRRLDLRTETQLAVDFASESGPSSSSRQ